MRRSVVLSFLLVALSVVVSSCGGSGNAAIKRPQNAPVDAVKWFRHPAPDGKHVVVGIVRGPQPLSKGRPGILIVPGTDALNAGYDSFAQQLSTLGFDVAVGCWFGAVPVTPGSAVISCGGGPKFKGVADSAVADLDSLVDAAKSGLGTDRISVVGFSRGGGIAVLRATKGSTEPVVSVAGEVEGSTTLGTLPGEVDIVKRAADIHVPVLLLHGESDATVPVQQARDLEAALRTNGRDVAAWYYPGQGHNLLFDATVRADVAARIAFFTCAHIDCSSPDTGR
jgi:dienelactone hydrolase